MGKRINVHLDNSSISAAVSELRRYAAWVERKETELTTRLSQIGLNVAKVKFYSAAYDGTNDVTVRVEQEGSTAWIYAEGTKLLFIEFGSGMTYGYGHPEAGKHGYGPGTWSDGPNGKGHWDDPHGWWYAGKKTLGNPPAMAMWGAVQEMTEQVTKIAREVFRT